MTKAKASPDEEAPVLFKIAISFFLSITTITMAELMLMLAARIIASIITMRRALVEAKFSN